MFSDRRLRKFIRQWRGRYPYPLPWVDDRANKQCRRSENEWLARFDGASNLKRRDVISLAMWRFGGQAEVMEQAIDAITGPGPWGHARRCIQKALSVSNPMSAVDLLIGETGGVPGWGPSMASVVLAVCRPSTYAVADSRALSSLKALELYEPAVEGEFSRADWWPYLRACRHLSVLADVRLSDVSRALWAAADDAPGPPKASKPSRRGPMT